MANDPAVWSWLPAALACVVAVRVLRAASAVLVCLAVVGVWLGWWQWESIWAWLSTQAAQLLSHCCTAQ